MNSFYPLMLLMCAGTVAARLKAARVLSGQTVCLEDPQHLCYKIAYFHDISSRVSFKEAQQACETDEGALLSITSPSEQRNIEHLLQALWSGAMGGAKGRAGKADGDFWIGLTREGGANQTQSDFSSAAFCSQLYYWTDGSGASFRNWYFDEPSCGSEACVVMYHQPTALPGLGGAYLYQWNDDRCNMKHNFICKYDPDSLLVTEHSNVPAGGDTASAAGGGGVTLSANSEDAPPKVPVAGASGLLLLYVVIPTIPLLLLILVASGTCCFQMMSRSHSTKPPADPSALWISRRPKTDSMEV
ncbi:Chondrolectin [Oryzias melastigma]|uniref:Chondrolectin n=1 Tax=Oryzias melastigma TaxID=30732 RepID=A0A3B3BTS8_ORYME|nr:chondrolectin [Oryzias melastigma]KAF6722132.1 Chondrolectin [Oryzias melastigma]